MSDDTLKKLKSRKKLESYYFPSSFRRFLDNINPMTSLGGTAGTDIREKSITISVILIFTLTIAILSTINIFHINEEKNKNLYISIASISWFVFLNFSFLIFEATKLFNILLFTALITLAATVGTNMEEGNLVSDITVAIIALGIIPLIILSYYYLSGSDNGIVQIKDAERERKDKEERKKLVDNYKKEVREAVKKELTEDITSQDSIKRKIADAYLDKLINDAKKGSGEKKKKKKEKEKDEKEEKEEEEE